MKRLFIRFNRWFELRLGWIFINGRKKDCYVKEMKKKYKK